MEHLQHFGLARDPFCNEPIADLFQEMAPHRDALLRLERAARQHKGLCVLTGAHGAGKTMVVRQLLEVLEEEVFEAGLLVMLNAAADTLWMLTRLARQLGVEEPAEQRDALVAEIYERLAIIREEGRHTVLLIDGAEALLRGDTLVDLCGLLKLEYEERRLFTLILAGGPRLAQALAQEPSLSTRVESHVALAPLDAAASQDYLASRVRASGGAVAILEEDAMAAVHELGGGLPGRMNVLADNALFEAFLASRRQMSRADVERAHRDLHWSGEAGGEAAPNGAAAPAPAASEPAPLNLGAPEGDSILGEEDVIEPEGRLDDLDSELDAAFAMGSDPGRSGSFAPPTRLMESEVGEADDLVVELIED